MLHSGSQGCHHPVKPTAEAPGIRRLTQQVVWTALMCASMAAMAQPSRYRVTLVDPGPEFGGFNAGSLSMNNRGEVVGSVFYKRPRDGGGSPAVVWSADRGARQLRGPRNIRLIPVGISDGGTVYGDASQDGADDRIFIWTESGGTKVSRRTGEARDVTAEGRAVGVFYGSSGVTNTILMQPDGSRSKIRNRDSTEINDAGQVVKLLKLRTGFRYQFVDLDGSVTPIGDFNSSCFFFAQAHELSPAGVVVGYGRFDASCEDRAFAWTREGGFRDLGTVPGTPGAQYSYANGVNSAGAVVGEYRAYPALSYTAFLWTDATGMLDATELIDPEDPAFGQLRLTRGVAINESGQILASAETLTRPGRSVAVVLTPVTP